MKAKLRCKLCWMTVLLVVLGAARPLLADDSGSDQPGLMSFDLGSAIWILISFLILLAILYKMAWKNVVASLDGREQRIRGDIRAAEDARAKAESLMKEHEKRMAGAEQEVRDILARAAADAEKIGANIRAAAQTEAQAQLERARKEIDSAQRQAIRQVYEKAAEIATDVAAKIISRELRPEDQQDLVNQTLGQLDAIGIKS
jgi:F-type H+-transporting ATPase subunit b